MPRLSLSMLCSRKIFGRNWNLVDKSRRVGPFRVMKDLDDNDWTMLKFDDETWQARISGASNSSRNTLSICHLCNQIFDRPHFFKKHVRLHNRQQRSSLRSVGGEKQPYHHVWCQIVRQVSKRWPHRKEWGNSFRVECEISGLFRAQQRIRQQKGNFKDDTSESTAATWTVMPWLCWRWLWMSTLVVNRHQMTESLAYWMIWTKPATSISSF